MVVAATREPGHCGALGAMGCGGQLQPRETSAGPYSLDKPLPPWVSMAWPSALSEASAATNLATLASSAASPPPSCTSAARAGRQPGQLDGDMAPRARMRDAVVRADGGRPDLPFADVVAGLGDGIAVHAVGQRCGQDPLRIGPANTCRRPLPRSPINASGPSRKLSKNSVNCFFEVTISVDAPWDGAANSPSAPPATGSSHTARRSATTLNGRVGGNHQVTPCSGSCRCCMRRPGGAYSFGVYAGQHMFGASQQNRAYRISAGQTVAGSRPTYAIPHCCPM
jgi:hypothetical protein